MLTSWTSYVDSESAIFSVPHGPRDSDAYHTTKISVKKKVLIFWSGLKRTIPGTDTITRLDRTEKAIYYSDHHRYDLWLLSKS